MADDDRFFELSRNLVQIVGRFSGARKKVASKSRNLPPPKIGYARVSTSDQNPDMQIAALKEYGVPEEMIFVDRASGGTMDRPQFVTAMKYAQAEGSEFVVWKLDRLGRTLDGILETLKTLNDRGIAFVSLTERLDTTGPMGKAMLHIIAVVAELERDLIRERTIAGIERARARGEVGGRPRAMTDERIALAIEMLERGDRGAPVWKAVAELPGPKVSRAAYYAWQKQWDADRDAGELGDPESE